MKTIKATNLERINEISANAKSVVTFTLENYFHGKALKTAPDFVAKLINQAFKEGAKLQDLGNGEYRLNHNANHWLEIKTK